MAEESYLITFLRHGESVGNQEKRFQGHADYPLTQAGREQARRLAEHWRTEKVTFDRALSSPLLRARETAEIICGALQIDLEFDPDWREMNNGLIAGLTYEEGAERCPRPAFMTPYTHFGKTGESRWELYLRAGHCIQRLLDRPPGRYLVVSHGGILTMTMYAILCIPPQADDHGPRFLFNNTTFATCEYNPGQHNWYMRHFGCPTGGNP